MVEAIKNSSLSGALIHGGIKTFLSGIQKKLEEQKETFYKFSSHAKNATRSDSREPKVEVYACVTCGRYSYKFRFASGGCLVSEEAIKDM